MREPQIIARVGLLPEKFLFQPWVACNDKHKLLFVFWETDFPVFEMHIASPKQSILSCRKLTIDAMQWLFSLGAKKIVTNCPKGKISNMAEKLGMSKVAEDGVNCFYEVEKWVLEPQ